MKSSEKKIAYQIEYDKKTGYAAQKKYSAGAFHVSLAFKDSDADVIAKLRTVENKTDYVRRLILADIGKE